MRHATAKQQKNNIEENEYFEKYKKFMIGDNLTKLYQNKQSQNKTINFSFGITSGGPLSNA